VDALPPLKWHAKPIRCVSRKEIIVVAFTLNYSGSAAPELRFLPFTCELKTQNVTTIFVLSFCTSVHPARVRLSYSKLTSAQLTANYEVAIGAYLEAQA